MSDGTDALLAVSGLSYRYPSAAKPAVDGVGFTVAAGEYVALLGANGSGKSTLARLVAGLLSPDSGSISLAPAKAPFRVPVGMVFQSPGDQIVAESVELDIAFGPENLGLARSDMESAVSSAIAQFGLDGLQANPTAALPTGRKQHLALASVVALSPAFLVLDEPTSMLGETARKSFLGYLDRLRDSGITILHITHDLDEAARADRAIALEDGRVAFDGEPEALLSLPADDLVRLGLAFAPASRPNSRRGAESAIDGEPALSCRNLSYGPLSGVSLDLYPGTVTAISGESGSGKTLLLELLAGLRTPESGTVTASGGLSPRSRAALAVQESESSLFAEFVADDVAWGPKNAGLAGDSLRGRVRESMNLAGLPFEAFADRRTFSLSGGERRKAALAGIIAMDAPVVLLDEPFSALDARSRGQFSALILALKDAGKAVVFTATRENEREIADRHIQLPAPAGPDTDRTARQTGRAESGAARNGPDRAVDRELRALERLRAGEAGYQTESASPVHRLTPLGKFVVFLSLAAATLASGGGPALWLLAALSPCLVLFARLPFGRFLKGLARVVPWLVLLGLVQYLFFRDIAYIIDFSLRFAALYGYLSAFVAVTSHTEIMYGIEDFFSPLRLLGVPARDLSLVAGIVFRFIPLLYGEAARIATARLVRGGSAPSRRRGLIDAVGSAASLFVPLMLRTLTRSERLAEAIHARYYGTGKNSRFLLWKSGMAERILLIAAPVAAAIIIVLSRL